jgi:YcaO-like protein with predicted kinase domain
MQDNLRSLKVQEVYAWLYPIAKQVGVTRLANITGLDTIGVPIWTAIRPTSRSLVTSLGKGLDDTSAKVSALMESIEVWHAETIECNKHWASIEDMLRTESIIELPHLKQLQRYNIREGDPIAWMCGTDLLSGEKCWTPWDCVSLDMTATRSSFVQHSHGLAGGSTVQEAEIYAMLELIERDAIAQWELDDLSLDSRPILEQASINRHELVEIIRRVEVYACVAFIDISILPEIYVYACFLVDNESSTLDPVGTCAGYAAHPIPYIAALKALLEAIQARAAMIAGAREDLDVEEFTRSRNADEARSMRKIFSAPKISKPFPSSEQIMDVNDTHKKLLIALEAKGCNRIISHDLTKQSVRVPVVKIVCPRLKIPQVSFERA